MAPHQLDGFCLGRFSHMLPYLLLRNLNFLVGEKTSIVPYLGRQGIGFAK